MPTLDWIGKKKVVNHHLDVPFRVLEKKYTYSADNKTESSENKIIHGDNLEALKSLLPEYEGKIDCIYIDPPYNTAKSSEKNKAWVYSDNVDDPYIKKWLNLVVGDEDNDFTRHDKWLCMMYPRLKLLWKLLSFQGVIFISIDDNECSNLRLICDEIFGRKNFITQFVWRSDGNFDNQAKVKEIHEYILCYSKEIDNLGLPTGIDPSVNKNSKIFNSEIRNTVIKNGPKNPMSEVVLPAGFPASIEKQIIKQRLDGSVFPYYFTDAIIENFKLKNTVIVKSGWSSNDVLKAFIKNGFNPVLDSKKQLTRFVITNSGAIEMIKERGKPSHVLSILQNLGSTQAMSLELEKMGLKFNFPKPNKLLEYILNFYSSDDSIILDSFAGSGTTAHAVLNLNRKDNGNRKFILIELMDYAESITAERVKRVIKGYGKDKNYTEGLGGDFTFYELGEPLLINELLNEKVPTENIRKYIWYTETNTKFVETKSDENKYFLGSNFGTSYFFYYEKNKPTTLDMEFLSEIKNKYEQYVIYADICLLPQEFMQRNNIIFKKIPRDIKKF